MLQREDRQAASQRSFNARQALTVPVESVTDLWCDVCKKEGLIQGVLNGIKSQYLSRDVSTQFCVSFCFTCDIFASALIQSVVSPVYPIA